MRYLIALIFGFIAWHSEALTGNQLYEKMLSKDSFEIGESLAYVNASLDAIHFQRFIVDKENNRKLNICIPDGVTVGQTSDLIKSYLAENPKGRHLPAYSIIYHVLMIEWPCKID